MELENGQNDDDKKQLETMETRRNVEKRDDRKKVGNRLNFLLPRKMYLF